MKDQTNKSVLSGSLLPVFKKPDFEEMNNWCLLYRDIVRGGGMPSKEQDAVFLSFSHVCFEAGVAHE
tara:strand:- start:311 stop:511 length:201 start_codon:yes stop_codon:yes gene_type:complete